MRDTEHIRIMLIINTCTCNIIIICWGLNNEFREWATQRYYLLIASFCHPRDSIVAGHQKTNFGPIMFFSSSCLLLYRSSLPLCKGGIIHPDTILVKVIICCNSLLGTQPTIKGYEIEDIMLPTQHPVRMALLFSFF